MPTRASGRQKRVTTMVCADCDVTWRGGADDECWSCGSTGKVTEATPRHVRIRPTAEDERLVG